MSALELDPLEAPLLGTTLIEASAGTGKTHTITTLYLRLLLEQELSVERILVLTFTRAATAELAGRIRKRIAELLAVLEGQKPADPELEALAARRSNATRERDRVRLLASLYSFDLAAIFTIHSFCLRMLQQYALEGGMGFDWDLAADAERLADELCDDFFLRLAHETQDPLTAAVFAAGSEKGELAPQKLRARLHTVVRLKLRHPDLVLLAPGDGAEPLEQWWSDVCQRCLEFVSTELERRSARYRQLSFDSILQRFRAAVRNSDQLASLVRNQFPAALIDEFQDTDPVQYDIFRTLYLGRPECALFLIGDPKQAIYAFRGADVFAYLRGKRDAERRFTLVKNWRSWPALVSAVNTVFSRRVENPFLLEGIDFTPAQPALTHSAPEAGLEFLYVEPPESATAADPRKPLPKEKARPLVCDIVAQEIRSFTAATKRIAHEEVSFGSIAVLCNTNDQALQVQRALRKLGIPTALESEASVFESEEARELAWVLAAVADPSDASATRRALATSLFGVPAEEIASLLENQETWERRVEQFFDWRDRWQRFGTMAVIREILEANDAAARMLSLVDGERRMTNFLHLAELLQRATIEQRLDPLGVVRWLAAMRARPEARAAALGSEDDAQLRLESDEHAVKLVTIHKSKGLQYPVVYCPFLWEAVGLRSGSPLLFHDPEDFALCLDARLQPAPVSKERTQRERAAEERRRLYVALTRAQVRCTVLWGPFLGAEKSALGSLLGASAGSPLRYHDFEALARSSNDTIRARLVSLQPTARAAVPSARAEPLRMRPLRRRFADSWQIASFTTLTHGHDPTRPVLREGVDFDSMVDTNDEAPGEMEPALLFRTFPPGAHTGELLHRVFERLDFTRPLEEQRSFFEAALAASPFGELEDLESSIEQVLETELPVGFRLAEVPRRACLHELDFLLPVQPTREGRLVDPERLARVFERHCLLPNARDYAAAVARLPAAAWEGFLKGYIDLVFEHAGRWYLVDYKSNQLGPRVDDYLPERLLPVMAQHHYVLQYHLYTVALHRFLRSRLNAYDYQQHFGGVLYLFLRAVSPQNPKGSGVFFDCPPYELVAALDELFAGGEPV